MSEPTTLVSKLNAIQDGMDLEVKIPDDITSNLSSRINLRPYQHRALERFIFYRERYLKRVTPEHLLFHMATGSGKTVLMAALILYLYSQGYRNFLFFVNTTQIIEKTKDNFLNRASSKYLFDQEVRINGEPVEIRSVDNFDAAVENAININFTTVQALHYGLQRPKENSLTYEDFGSQPVVMISDEAHHLNALTKSRLSEAEAKQFASWEGTVCRIAKAHPNNVLLEFTATVDMDHSAIRSKYADKVLFQYSLKEYREDKYSKDIELRQADLPAKKRMLQAIVLSQFRRKIAESFKLHLKPVILMKSKTIAESAANEAEFHNLIKSLKADELSRLRQESEDDATLARAFEYIYDDRKLSAEDLVRELKLDFAPEKVVNVNRTEDLERRQVQLNNLEDRDNEIRTVFAVDKLNEGWDVLNLFDIVRLYDTRDGKSGKVGHTTMQEAQLIGRGARYYPFIAPGNPGLDPEKRKFDNNLTHPLRMLEVLHYHASHNPKYIQDLRGALRETGMLDETQRTVTLKVKDNFKATDVYKTAHIWVNRRVVNSRTTVKGLDAYLGEKHFTFSRLMSGLVSEASAFDTPTPNGPVIESVSVTVNFPDLGLPILRFALDSSKFFRFEQLKRLLPSLKSMHEFMTSSDYLGAITVNIRGPRDHVDNLSAQEKLDVAQFVLRQIEHSVRSTSVEFLGSTDFQPLVLRDVVVDKNLKIRIEGEAGRSWKESELEGLSSINLDKKDWHVYDDCYGTDQEKEFVRFLSERADLLYKHCDAFYLIRNERLVQLYNFADGRAVEPDYLLLLYKQTNDSSSIMQVFIEPKGLHLKAEEKWKSDFLQELGANVELVTIFQGQDYKIVGLPFYNSMASEERSFEVALSDVLESGVQN